MWKRWKKKYFGRKSMYQLYLFALVPVLFILIFNYFPMYGVTLAFKDFSIRKGIMGSKWVGFKYFEQLFRLLIFGQIVGNTLSLSLMSLIIGFPFPILFAILLNELKSVKLRKLTQTITYMPHFIYTVVICGLMKDFCSEKGVIMTIISTLTGMEPDNLFSRAEWFQPLYVVMCIWQEFGWDSIIYYAAVTGIDQELYEAAEIDGANRFNKIFHITLPGISSTVVVLLIMRIGNMMTLGWDKILLLYNAMTYKTSDVISTYVYRIGLTNFQYSFATAVGFFNSVINFTLLILANTVSKKVNETSLW